jgi:hypothetical protein
MDDLSQVKRATGALAVRAGTGFGTKRLCLDCQLRRESQPTTELTHPVGCFGTVYHRMEA